MRFPILALAIFGTIVSMSISATAILPRRGLIDLTTSPDGPDSAVAPPRAADRPHQATREEVVARAALRARQPAKRQTSAVSVCARPDTGTVPYAVLTNSYFYTSNQIGGDITESQADCYAACEADTGESLIFSPSVSFRPLCHREGCTCKSQGRSPSVAGRPACSQAIDWQRSDNRVRRRGIHRVYQHLSAPQRPSTERRIY